MGVIPNFQRQQSFLPEVNMNADVYLQDFLDRLRAGDEEDFV
jgi:hypothetical protein